QPSRLFGYAVEVAATGAAAGAAEALVAPMSGRATTAAPVPATARVRARRRPPKRRVIPVAGMFVCPLLRLRGELSGSGWESARPCPFGHGFTPSRSGRMSGPATYLGPPLLPCVSDRRSLVRAAAGFGVRP